MQTRAGIDRGEVDHYFVDYDGHRRYIDPVAYAHLQHALIMLQDPVLHTIPDHYLPAVQRLLYSAWSKGSSVPMPLPEIEVQRVPTPRQTAAVLTLLLATAMIGTTLGALHFSLYVIASLWACAMLLIAWAWK